MRITNKFIFLFLFLLSVLSLCFYLCLPYPLFKAHYSTVLLDRNKELLCVQIADDGQWRFPQSDSIPEKFIFGLLEFEDRYFYSHPGVNPFAFIRAFKQNIQKGKISSGGSTISMQVIRLSRKNKQRNYLEKVIEVILALRLELSYSKKEILEFYVTHAPFGGNNVGIAAASWRYFNRPASELSWAEAATLAVLPNAPSLIFPGKNQHRLKAKRDRLLKKLYLKNYYDKESYLLSISEPLPQKAFYFPKHASHLLVRSIKEGHKGSYIHSTIDIHLQERLNHLLSIHYKQLSANQIHNAAVLVADVSSGKLLAYCGNIPGIKNEYGKDVDIVQAARSTGSILKPFLYAAMLHEGTILPRSLVADIPTQIGGFAPKNFVHTYDGAVSAKWALARSLNVPFVRMLQKYGIPKFHKALQDFGIKSINKHADHYGLSLILGGAEASLWELTGVYAGFARRLKNYSLNGGKYSDDDIRALQYISAPHLTKTNLSDEAFPNAAAIYYTFDAMNEVIRPEAEANWRYFNSSGKIAWKTGTSFGFRDAWAIGTNPSFTVGVWVGNASGEGRPGLTGIGVAAPLLFDVFNFLPKVNQWFDRPFDELVKSPICRKSGYKAGEHCEPIDTVYIPAKGLESPVCIYHKLIHLDEIGKKQVNSSCYPIDKMQHSNWFVLPPSMEYYYKAKHAEYKVLPLFAENCISQNSIKSMEVIYPRNLSHIYIPIDITGNLSESIFEVSHRQPNSTIYWHIDDVYIGETNSIHKMAIRSEKGKHILTLVDNKGEILKRNFIILEK
jgi:penicillin-binding protein 1C